MVSTFFLIIFTYIVFGTSVYIFTKFITNTESSLNPILFVISLGSAPILLSWILEKLMYFFPSLNDISYILMIFIFFSLPLILNYSNLRQRLIEIKCIIQSINIYIYFVIILMFTGALFPVYSNDPLQYLSISREIYTNKDFSLYPFVDTSLEKGYFPWTHPSGYIGLLVWSDIIQGTSLYPGISKLINIFYAIYAFLLFYFIFIKSGKIFSFFAGISIFFTPLYVILILQYHIDIMRVFTFFTPFVFLAIIIEDRREINLYIMLGILVGLSMHSHSLGLISFIMIAFIIVLENYKYPKKLMKKLFITSFIAIFFVLFRYIDSYDAFGYFLGDNTPIWQLKFLNYKDYLITTRDLATLENRLFNGLLKGFTHLKNFGFTYWLLISLIIYSAYKDKNIFFVKILSDLCLENRLFKYSIIVVLLWYSVAVASTVMGSDNFIKNDRYLITIQFFIVYMNIYMILKLFMAQKNDIIK